MGKVANYRRTNFSPELWRKDCCEQAICARVTHLHLMEISDQEGPAQKFAVQRGEKITHKKRRRRTKFCSHWRPMRGRIRTKTTTINHTNIFIHILVVNLCISGWIGRLWLSRYHFSSAALFRVLQHRLIVLIYIFSYNNSAMKLKLSHT